MASNYSMYFLRTRNNVSKETKYSAIGVYIVIKDVTPPAIINGINEKLRDITTIPVRTARIMEKQFSNFIHIQQYFVLPILSPLQGNTPKIPKLIFIAILANLAM